MTQQESRQAEAKKPYVAPRLVTHGDARKLTQHHGHDDKGDAGSHLPLRNW